MSGVAHRFLSRAFIPHEPDGRYENPACELQASQPDVAHRGARHVGGKPERK
jgi:hypothetical protein